MSMRIILAVRGSLASGGSFAVSSSSNPSRSGNTTHVISANRGAGQGGVPANPVLSLRANDHPAAMYAVPLADADKTGTDWDGKSSVNGGRDQKVTEIFPVESQTGGQEGVRVTVETENDFGGYQKEKN